MTESTAAATPAHEGRVPPAIEASERGVRARQCDDDVHEVGRVAESPQCT